MIRLRKRRWPTLRMMASATKGAGGVSNPRQRQPDHLGHPVRNRLRQGKERQVHQLRDAHCPPPLHGDRLYGPAQAPRLELAGRGGRADRGEERANLSWGRKNPAVPCWHGETSAIMGLGGKIPAGVLR